jgi:hypothetical protein
MVQREALILAIHDAFYVAGAICVVGILISLSRGRRVSEPVAVDRSEFPSSV